MTVPTIGSFEASGRPRILLVGEGPPALGGIAAFIADVRRRPALAERFELDLLNTARTGRDRTASPGRIGSANASRTLRDIRRMWRSARRADLVHLATALLPTPTLLRAVALAMVARARGAAVVVHVHTGLANVGPYEDFEPTRLQRALLRLLPAERVLAVSSAGATGLSPHVRAPIQVVDNAVDVTAFAAPARSERRPVRIVYAGTIGRGKGLLDLLEALLALRAWGVDGWSLRVVGAPNELEHEEPHAVADRFLAAGLGGSLVGPRPPEELPALLAEADVFVLPSHSEGQPIAVLEAMASGLAIVATRVGAVPDVIRDGVDGLLVAPRDVDGLARALRAVVEDPELRRRLGWSARRRAIRRFDVDRLSEDLDTVWTSVLGSPTRDPAEVA